MTSVTAVIVNYNAGAYLARCVGSLYAAGIDHVAVGDNASTDDSLDDLRRQHPGTRVIEFSTPLGFGTAINRLAEGVDTDYVLIANPDLIVEPDCVQQLVEGLRAHPEAMVAGARILNADGSLQRAVCRRRPTPMRSLITALGLDRLASGVNVQNIPHRTACMFGTSGALLLFRHEDWQALGGYDEGYFLHCEDLDLFARIDDRFDRCALFVPDATAVHEHGVSQRGHRRAAADHKLVSMLRYYHLHEKRRVAFPLRWIWPIALRIRHALLWPLYWLQDIRRR